MFAADKEAETQDTAEITVMRFTSHNCKSLGCPGISMIQYMPTDLPHLEQQLKVRWGALRHLKWDWKPGFRRFI